MVSDGYLDGNLVKIRGPMGAGKTAYMVALAVDKLRRGIYLPCQVLSNVSIPSYGIEAQRNDILDHYLSTFVKEVKGHRLVLFDEADQFYSHRDWADKKKSTALRNLWQCMKLGVTMIYTMHEGFGVDTIMREAAMVSVWPQLIPSLDVLILHVIDGRKGKTYKKVVSPISGVFGLYNRREAVY